MRKRERENPCMVCGHYHKYEEGEVCGICGHRMPETDERTTIQLGAFPSEILPEFLYLGSYDNASRSELLKAQGISRILNTLPSCQNLYRNSFVYHSLQDDKSLQFDDAIQFLGQPSNVKHLLAWRRRMKSWVLEFRRWFLGLFGGLLGKSGMEELLWTKSCAFRIHALLFENVV